MPPVRRSRFPGFEDPGGRRRELIEELARPRRESELSQTEIAARMGTSQSAVARLESGELDARLSTVERYAAAPGRTGAWQGPTSQAAPRRRLAGPPLRGGAMPMTWPPFPPVPPQPPFPPPSPPPSPWRPEPRPS